MDRLLVVFLLTAFINLINSLTRSSRLSGVRTGSLATAISLFSVVYLAASFANTLQAPLLASTVEMIIKGAYDQALLLAPGPTSPQFRLPGGACGPEPEAALRHPRRHRRFAAGDAGHTQLCYLL